jgi:hypothetical protein
MLLSVHSSHREPGVPQSQLGLPVNGKRMKTDVPDPPVELVLDLTAGVGVIGPQQIIRWWYRVVNRAQCDILKA